MASYAHLQGQVDAFFTKSAGQTDSAALRSEASGLVEAAVSAAGQEILKGQRGDEHGFSAAKLFFELALRLDATNQAARAGVEKAHAALNAVGLQITIPRTQLVADGRGGVRLAYAPYDWTTNASDSTSDYDATATRSEYSWLLGG